MSESRNPLIFPVAADVQPAKRLCPNCKHDDFSGRNVQGVITYTCVKCKAKWGGGLPQVPADPRIPLEATNPADRPSVSYEKGTNELGEKVIKEVLKRQDLTQDFRKGAYVPEGDE